MAFTRNIIASGFGVPERISKYRCHEVTFNGDMQPSYSLQGRLLLVPLDLRTQLSSSELAPKGCIFMHFLIVSIVSTFHMIGFDVLHKMWTAEDKYMEKPSGRSSLILSWVCCWTQTLMFSRIFSLSFLKFTSSTALLKIFSNIAWYVGFKLISWSRNILLAEWRLKSTLFAACKIQKYGCESQFWEPFLISVTIIFYL